MHETFDLLQKQLLELVENFGLKALKTGTEVEDMSFRDISVLRDLSRDILPLYVKLGGPEARNDIREMESIGVDGLIAPMIESVYSLKKYISTLKEILSPKSYKKIEKGINLETINGFREMNAILSSEESKELHQITAARTDLSGSMDLNPDDERVLEICSVIVARARENDLRTSVGGSIHPEIAAHLIEVVNPNTINTRHMVISTDVMRKKSPGDIILCHLQFEAELNEYFSMLPGCRQKIYATRAETIRKRMSKKFSEKSC